jgi:hypothetical protein
MSFPTTGGVSIAISLGAAQAAELAWRINWALSRAQDAQEAVPDFFVNPDKESAQTWSISSSLKRVPMVEGVILSILPDERSPGTSAYMNYSGPHEKQYIKDETGAYIHAPGDGQEAPGD